MKIDSSIISSGFVVNAKTDPYDIDLKLTFVGGPGQNNGPDIQTALTCLGTCGADCRTRVMTCLGSCGCG